MAKKVVCEFCGKNSCNCGDVRVYFCPECHSANVRYIFGIGNLFGVIPKMKCFECGYTASAFPLLETNKKELSKKVSKKKSSTKKRAVSSKKVVKKAKKKVARKTKSARKKK